MAYENTFTTLQAHAATAPAMGKTLKFELGEHIIYIDGTGATNVVSAENKDADCAISVTLEDLEGLMSGSLNPMTAFMSGKIKVKGDMSVAMKLQSLLKG
jgi:acyl-CoA dehydrogenase